jgi:hypothetical protein
MKAKDVPQDDADMMRGKWKDPIYTVDEDGNYTTSYSMGWDVKNTVMQQAWDNINEKVEGIRQRVLSGELSPIAYYMEKNIMDVGLLAKYMGLWRWKVKKHLKKKHFEKLSDDVLAKYADIFNLTPDELNDIDLMKSEEQKG